MSISGIGIFARTFTRRSAAEVAKAVRGAGFTLVQFNFSAIGLDTLHPGAQPSDFEQVALSFRQHGTDLWGLSATYNVIHPDRTVRDAQTRDALRLIGMSCLLSVTAVTLCTGTRNPRDMWTWHPDNHSPTAWRDMRATLDALLPAAASANVVLGIEPEPANVICDARQAARLLRELGPDTVPVGIVLDPGNLVTPATLDHQQRIIPEAFDLLGEHVIGLQAKDLNPSGPAALGHGQLDYDLIIPRAQQLPRQVPIIIQDVTEQDAARSGAFLRARIATASRA
jgi:sugar phosphate isomerase/epimerase